MAHAAREVLGKNSQTDRRSQGGNTNYVTDIQTGWSHEVNNEVLLPKTIQSTNIQAKRIVHTKNINNFNQWIST